MFFAAALPGVASRTPFGKIIFPPDFAASVKVLERMLI